MTNALGYFVNLVGDVVGGSVPPNFDKSTHGSSADLVAMVFTENAKENPWKTTYAEEAGFKPSDSIVTHFSAYLGNANIDHDSKTGQRLLTTLSTGLLGSGFRPRLLPCRLRCHLCHQQQGFLRVHRPVPRARGDHCQGLSGPAGRPRLHAGNGGHAVQVLLAGNLRSGQGLRSL